MSQFKNIIFRFLPALLWALFIFQVSSYSNPSALWKGNPSAINALPRVEEAPVVSSTSTHLSKDELIYLFLHILEYTILAELVLSAVVWNKPVHLGPCLTALVVCTLYAFSDEIHQHFVPGRAFQWSDLGLDFIGILAGCLLYLFINKGNRIKNNAKTENL